MKGYLNKKRYAKNFNEISMLSIKLHKLIYRFKAIPINFPPEFFTNFISDF